MKRITMTFNMPDDAAGPWRREQLIYACDRSDPLPHDLAAMAKNLFDEFNATRAGSYDGRLAGRRLIAGRLGGV